MGKIALITDQHFGVRNDNLVFLNYFEKFYKNVFFPYLIENRIQHIIDLGDTFDRRKYINFLTLQRSREMWFDQVISNGRELHCIVGNHCTYFRNTLAVNSPTLLLSDPAINIYASPAELMLYGTKIALMPWITQESYEDSMNFLKETNANILFGHLELSGFEMHRGTFVEEGMSHEVFSKFEVVCSGHLHHKSSRGNINYLGCPYEMSWQDYQDQKGFHVFDTNTRELTFIPNPYTLYKKFYYDDSNHTIESMMDSFNSEDYADTYTKFIVVSKTNPYLFDMVIDRLEKVSPASMEIIDEEFNYSSLEDQALENIDDTLTVIQKTIDSIDDVNVDRIALKSLMNKLYEEALLIE